MKPMIKLDNGEFTLAVNPEAEITAIIEGNSFGTPVTIILFADGNEVASLESAQSIMDKLGLSIR